MIMFGEYEVLEPQDLFGQESMVALNDIAAEFGEEEVVPFGQAEDAKAFVKEVCNY
jgi:hypothetical protein